MRVVIKEPNKKAEIREINNRLEDFQSIVGGYIEVYPIRTDLPLEDILIILNEEGKLMDLEPNMIVGNELIVGNMIFVSEDNGDFKSLSDDQLFFLKQNKLF